ncbi:hypothetical protein NT2_05_02860 [Caenibius tardaugens NBRC 16725]|uniref:SPOR domain-containing protein n=1 Tax=Caenibius tardaugens NBRC 16725 TaxID=1219035 RepID=U2Y841_9SPHN|nr:SPOR domain-containing protein [Caenibius tardaugens]AZI36704.1 SPOR domain-containing protein [Caenibius tardaugens NBRC 16725]GAD49366.1 hypothetical protein NT2_05_02860 [Caenibius tardaugens NBRC 16725]
MTRTNNSTRMIGLTLAAVLASTALTACSTANAPKSRISASQAETAIAKGDSDKAVSLAERAVMSDPNNAEYRALLGSAYLKAGRFFSAATSFDDAVALGDTSARTALSLALAQIGANQPYEAVAVLDAHQNAIPAADLGLAYALAGDPQRGVGLLTDALRNGENTPKVRQNLAYAYALSGEWRQARLMAAFDVPGEQLGDRMAQWAATIHPEAAQQRVAALLDAPVLKKDSGVPAGLARINGTPEQLAAAPVPAAAAWPTAPAPAQELPALGAPQPMPQIAAATPASTPTPALEPASTAVAEPAVTLASAEPNSFEAAFGAAAPRGVSASALIADTVRFISEPTVQQLPVRYGFANPTRPAPVAKAPALAASRGTGMAPSARNGDHLVQLGSFLSESEARQAWGVFTKRNSALGQYRLKITQANIKGKHYWRVAAAGFNKADARAMCATISAKGQGCLVYDKDNPLPGAVG